MSSTPFMLYPEGSRPHLWDPSRDRGNQIDPIDASCGWENVGDELYSDDFTADGPQETGSQGAMQKAPAKTRFVLLLCLRSFLASICRMFASASQRVLQPIYNFLLCTLACIKNNTGLLTQKCRNTATTFALALVPSADDTPATPEVALKSSLMMRAVSWPQQLAMRLYAALKRSAQWTMAGFSVVIKAFYTYVVRLSSNLPSPWSSCLSRLRCVAATRGALLAGAVLACAILFATARRGSVAPPKRSLMDFIHAENTKYVTGPASNLGDLPLDFYRTYEGATCVESDSWESLRDAARQQLSRLPPEVVEEVLQSALIEGVSVMSSLSDSVVSPDEAWKAHTFKAWYRTDAASLSTCILVSGVQILLQAEVAEWEVTTHYEVVGMLPCHCGLFSCSECPEFRERTRRVPVFKRHKLSLAQHEALAERMQARMVHNGRALLAGYGYAVDGMPGASWAQGSRRTASTPA
mmetsp:Transcript_24179/g.47159  ORF Transcript_24179/g.47159 Transcript_24179/m.47159 type:complete len:467 (+) Transcript_24179:87-1487(+)